MSDGMDVDETGEPPPLSVELSGSPILSAGNLIYNIENVPESLVDVLSDASSDATYVSQSEILDLDTEDDKDKVISESPSKKRRLAETIEEDDGDSCPICLDNWTTSGEHRLCSLKCGHLFGYNCLKRWLNSELRKTCPTCKEKVRISDIRYIYARKVIAMDTTELTIAKQKMNEAIEEKNRMQIELSKTICRVHSLTQEMDDCKKHLNGFLLKQGRALDSYRLGKKTSNSEIVNLYKEKMLDLGKNSSCRVFDCKSSFDLIVISAKSPNNLYSGFGIKTVGISNYKTLSFIPLHSQPIRDVKFHENGSWILTCSMDKKAKILDLNTNNITHTFDCESALWSCCWGTENIYTLYIGQQNGSVTQYDTRQPSVSLSTMTVQGDLSPVVSIQAIQSKSTPFKGLVSCKLNSAWLFDLTLDIRQSYALPVEGPFVSMSYQKDTDNLFLSSRPNVRYPYVRHFLCGFYEEEDGVKCNIVHTLRGGQTQKMLTRSCLISNKNNFAAAYIEDQRIVCLWDINTGKRVGSVPAYEPIFDLNCIRTNSGDFLLSLSESKLEFFKFVNQ